MSNNSFGEIFKITTFGESHGKSLGVVIDGCPSGLDISINEIQALLDLRKPGINPYTSPRKEEDKIQIVSGVFKNKTLGSPITLVVNNMDHKSADYDNLKDIYRPSHADFTWKKKYKHIDHRGGGRSSARETLARVAASAFSDKLIAYYCNMEIYAFVQSIGPISITSDKFDYDFINKNNFRTTDKNIIPKWENLLSQAIEKKDSLGGIVEIHIKNVPIGLGEPIYNKLNATLAKGLFSIPAVKGVQFGDAFSDLVTKKGSEANDCMYQDQNENIRFSSNNNAGILGGISNGEDIIIKVAIKPTSSIGKNQSTINHKGENTSIAISGRHDPCIAIRATSVCKAMCSLTLADHILLSKNTTLL